MHPLKNPTPPTPEDINQRRQRLREEFVANAGIGDVKLVPLTADASFRRYYRVEGASKPMLLMQDPPDRPAIPPYVMVEPFIKIADHLRDMGLRTPEIYHKDIENGLLLIEDFGDDTYTRIFETGIDGRPLYEAAIDVLVQLHKNPQRNDIDLPKHDASMLVDGAMLLLDWYLPAVTGKKVSDEQRESFKQVWFELFKNLPKDQETLVLRDFHVDNLMQTRDGKTSVERCGLLDFQDAAIGQFSYDVMSLLEDARRDMPKNLKDTLYKRYIDSMGADFDKEGFDYSFRVLAAQRHARVLGVFIRLSVRDGKDRYLDFIPHVHGLFLNAVNDPALKPLKDWFDKNGIDMSLLPNVKKTKGPTP